MSGNRHLKKESYLKVIVLTLLICQCFLAVANEPFTVIVSAKDNVTRHKIPFQCTILTYVNDSTCEYDSHTYGKTECYLKFKERPKKKQYQLEIVGAEFVAEQNRYFETKDYVPKYVEVDIPENVEDHFEIQVELERYRRRQLDEVTVKASKVMFYYKGDTLIYDAAAFVLAEGSMLDALLAQMPGVELNKNGEILCNGKRVQNLLVNGRDIFNGSRELMLENLAAYTIKDIAFYDKMGRTGELMGFKTGDELYVMDVRLKRNYSNGWIVNAEAGYGSERRYLGKLFGMWFSDNVSMTAYAGANNLSDNKTPGRSDEAWAQSDMGTGVASNQKGGITYDAKGFDDRWEIKGSVDAGHHTTDSRHRTSMENYLGSTNLYNYLWNNKRTNEISVSTGHEFFTKLGERANLNIKPEFSYSKESSSADNLSSVFRDKIVNISKARLLAIYSDGSSLSDTMLNRYIGENVINGHGINASLDVSSPIKLKSGFRGNMLELSASGAYSNELQRDFYRYVINYGADSRPVDFEHLYTRNYPHHDMKWSAGVTFTQYLRRPFGRISINYDFRYSEQTRTHDRFRLSDIAGYNPEQWPADLLPEKCEYENHFIPSLSDRSLLTEWTHHFRLVPWLESIKFRNDSWNMILWGNVDFDITRRKFDYTTDNKPMSVTRDDLLPTVSLGISLNPWASPNGWRYNVSYRFKRERINDMMYLVDRPVTNPLMIYRGNPNLKNTSDNFVTFAAESRQPNMLRHQFRLTGRCRHSAIDYYYTIDPQTGAYVYRAENVNGNGSTDLSYELFTPLGRSGRFNISTRTDLAYRRDVSNMRHNVMNNISAGENVKLNWQTGSQRVSLIGDVKMNRYLHSNQQFDDFTSWMCRYGAEAVLNLPHNWCLSTDLTLYTRRGYGDSRLNTTDLVWNARVSKSLLKGSLVLVADGYDLLRQLSNVSYTVNAQARTEVVTNVIPSYVLFHLQWRFNRQPRR